MPRWVILVLSLACGVAVSTIYFPQAISSLVAADLGVSWARRPSSSRRPSSGTRPASSSSSPSATGSRTAR